MIDEPLHTLTPAETEAVRQLQEQQRVAHTSDFILRADAIAACERVRAHWAAFHSVAPAAAAQCKDAIKAIPAVVITIPKATA